MSSNDDPAIPEIDSIPPGCTAIEGYVYDIRKMLTRHPGGERLIKIALQTDATAHFMSYHPPSAEAWLGSSTVPKIGRLTCPAPTCVTVGPFYKSIRSDVWSVLRLNHKRHLRGKSRASAVFAERIKVFLMGYLAWIATIVVSGVILEWNIEGVVLALLASGALGFTSYRADLALFAHMLDHHAVCKSHRATDIMLHASVPWGSRASEFITGAHHLHHAHTRVLGLDQTIANDWPSWIVRLSDTLPIRPANRMQHIVMPGLALVKPLVDSLHDTIACTQYLVCRDFAAGFSAPFVPRALVRGYDRDSPYIGRYDALACGSHWPFCIAFYVVSLVSSVNLLYVWFVMMPSMTAGLAWIVHNIAPSVCKSFTGEHSTDVAAYAMHLLARERPPSIKLYGHDDMISPVEHRAHDWGLQQAINSGNVVIGNDTSNVASGAAWQIEHHLFPGLETSCYDTITPIVQRHLREYGVDVSEITFSVDDEGHDALKMLRKYSSRSHRS